MMTEAEQLKIITKETKETHISHRRAGLVWMKELVFHQGFPMHLIMTQMMISPGSQVKDRIKNEDKNEKHKNRSNMTMMLKVEMIELNIKMSKMMMIKQQLILKMMDDFIHPKRHNSDDETDTTKKEN
ncbi:hypothetical protein Tco_0296162 [Tanacetum coccineum]